jgi:hypothetical protein
LEREPAQQSRWTAAVFSARCVSSLSVKEVSLEKFDAKAHHQLAMCVVFCSRFNPTQVAKSESEVHDAELLSLHALAEKE